MKTWIISDTHFNHGNIATYCQRPENFTELIIRNCNRIVSPEDRVIHVGDVFIGKSDGWNEIRKQLTGKWILVRGNHDRRSCSWYMDHGFDFACDGFIYRGAWITHKPASELPAGCNINIHGHLHNIWDGFFNGEQLESFADSEEEKIRLRKQLKYPWQRLFAIEYTNYAPVEFQKFVDHPDKYQARGRK